MKTSELTETVFFSSSEYFNSLLSDINNAAHSILLETYIYTKDDLGKRVGDALIRAAERGVVVHLLVDGIGTPFWGGSFTERLEKAGVKTRIFHSIPLLLWQWRRSVSNQPFLKKMFHLLVNVNFRNHRKVCIIDKKIAYVGSHNITQCHLEKKYGGDDWRDTAVRIQKNNIQALYDAFNAAWDPTPLPKRFKNIFQHVKRNAVFRLNNTRHRRRVLYKNLLHRVARCKKRIWITNAYFVPDNFLLKKLRDAAKKNVDVRILLPQKSDIIVMPWASTAFYVKLLKEGIRIFEYKQRVLHAKTLILDDWMIIGSSNMNHRSLLHDLEVDVTITKPESKQQLEQQFLNDLDDSTEINLDNWYHRPLIQRLIGRVCLYLKYWM